MSLALARLVYRNPAFWPSIQQASQMLRERCQPTLDARKAQELLARTFERTAA